MSIRTVTVIGANGTMGRNVSAIFASFGNAKVFMVCRDIEKAKEAAEMAVQSVKADSIRRNLVPADFSSLTDCVRQSDFVFDSVAENMAVKTDVISKIREALPEHAYFCSGTSGLSIIKLAEQLPPEKRGGCFGVHFFNPPYSLTLCELIKTTYSNEEMYHSLKHYLANDLRRAVVEVEDAPAFLGNRIGFQFLNEAMQYAQRYKDSGGIDYIDSILGPFSGRSMAPLVTSDFVGLDIHQAIVDNLYDNLPSQFQSAFEMPAFAVKLIKKGKLGRKTKGGLYKTQAQSDGTKKRMVYDISTGEYRDRLNYNFSFAEKAIHHLSRGDYRAAALAIVENESTEAEICTEFLLKYILYSIHAALSVGHSTHDADEVMVHGYGWCPPQAMLEWIASTGKLSSLIKERLPKDFLHTYDIDLLLKSAQKSRFDYRRYLYAKK